MSARICSRSCKAIATTPAWTMHGHCSLALLSLFCYLSLLGPRAALADVNIFSDITQDATWNLADSPYIITEVINIRARLIIDPGVVVKFTPGSGFNGPDSPNSPSGSIRAVGTAAVPITFTSNSTEPVAGDWGRISLPRNTVSSETIFEHCIFEYGGGSQTAMIEIYGVSPTIRNCLIQQSGSNGVSVEWGLNNPTPMVESCQFMRNRLAAITLDDTATFASIRSNIFQFHTAHPIVTHANSVGALRLNTFVDNTPNAIRILAGEVTTSQVLSSMGVPYVVFGGLIEIGANAELAIDPGVTLKFESGTGITTETLQNGVGILRAIGTASNPILFTSIHEIPTRGDWRGISIISDGPGFITSVVEYCIIEYAGQGGNGAVFISDANPAIRHCSITNSSNDGIQKDASPQNIPIIMQNNIFNNQRFDINNQSTTQMPARSNWWGSSEGALSNNGDVEASGHLASPILLGTPRSPFSLLYPHFAAGDEWLTLLFLTNVDAIDAVVGAQFYDSSGTPAQVQIGSEIASDFEFDITGGATRTIEITASELRTGWIELAPQQRVVSSLVFQSIASGIVENAAGVLPSDIAAEAWVSVNNDLAAGSYVGFGVSNPFAVPIGIIVELIDASGIKQNATRIDLLPMGHTAIFVHQLFVQAEQWNGYIKVLAKPGFIIVPLKVDGDIISTTPANKIR